MSECRMRFAIILAVILLLNLSIVSAETWHLEKGGDWKAVSQKSTDIYLLEVAKVKQLVYTGQTEQVRQALNKLKADFPEIADPDCQAFIAAEMLFAQGQFTKAAAAFDKFLLQYPESSFYEAALDRQFTIAAAFLAGREKKVIGVFKIKGFSEGIRIMEKISDRAGDAPITVKANIAIAKSFEQRAKFNDAYYKWAEIQSQWPTGRAGKDALLGMARCKHSGYKGPNYDASLLISAKTYYRNFKFRFPEDAEKVGVDAKLKQIDEQLAYKQFNIGRYYQKKGDKQSADIYYRMVMDDWPDSTAAKMVKRQKTKR